MAVPGFFPWHMVNILDDDVDGNVDINNLIRADRGSGRVTPHRSSDYRTIRREEEDGYDELDFA